MKYLLIIGDGMADNPVVELGGKTPLQYSDIKEIDEICKKGVIGSVRTVPEGLPAGSDTAILSIFGNDPRRCYTGRSPLEAAGAGIKLMPGNVSYRCNMVALDDNDLPLAQRRILSHSGGSIDGGSSIELITWLCAQGEFKAAAQAIGMKIHPTPSFRHIAVQDSAELEGFKATPPHDILKQTVGPYLPEGNKTADDLRALMEIGARLLKDHEINRKRLSEGLLPANGIWFWAEGTAVGLDDFYKKYGVQGVVISAVPLVFGIGALAGLKMVEVEGATGELETNYEGKAEAALEALNNGADFAAVHVEAPDECTHNGDLEGKLKSIEYISSRVVGPICQALRQKQEPFRLLLLSDHKTLTSTRTHDGDPVPFMLYDSTTDSNIGLEYTESNGEKGEFIEDGSTLIARLFNK